MLLRLAVGWALLALAWVIANPPFAAPDEMDHFVRTVGISQGHLVGAPAPDVNIGSTTAEIRFDKSTQRGVMMPADLYPAPFNCYIANPLLSAACLHRPPLSGPPIRYITSVGTYPPLGLLAPAAVIQAARDPLQAVRLGRAAAAIVALAFLISAAAAVFDPEAGWLSLSGVLATCTPTVIFLAASLNPSGASVAAGIALCASLLRIGRPAAAPAWVWTLLGCSGAMLLLSHPTGLAWTALLLAGFIALESPSTARRLVREQRRAAALGIGLLALGVLAALVWQGLYGPITPIAYRGWGIALGEAPSYTWHGLLDLIAGFGYLEFRIPLPFYLLWFAFVGVMAALAIRVGSRRERRAVIGAGVLAVLLVPAVWSVFGRAVGIGIIGREYLPVLAGFPMLCGEVLYRQRARLAQRDAAALASLATIAAVIQFVAWYYNARRSAVGTGGSLLFASHAMWSPPLGWVPWLAVAACGALVLLSVPLSRLAPARLAKAAGAQLNVAHDA
jgi:Predicted membrane protein (DUF2142)